VSLIKKIIYLTIIGCVLILSSFCFAQGTESTRPLWTPFQISLSPNAVLPPCDTVIGLRGNLLYGKTKSVTGVDIGIVQQTTENCVGLQLGAADLATNITGIQYSPFLCIAEDSPFLIQYGTLFNKANRITGVQIGFIEMADEIKGWQLGVATYAGAGSGVQFFGLFNWADRYSGYQFGIVNYSGVLFSGLQFSAASNYSNDASGFQFGVIYNRAVNFSGTQISFFLNDVKEVASGVQIGLFNSAKTSKGFQIGLINISRSRIMPFVNWPD
jgi:hypothetical protein